MNCDHWMLNVMELPHTEGEPVAFKCMFNCGLFFEMPDHFARDEKKATAFLEGYLTAMGDAQKEGI